MIRTVIASDFRLFREGLARILESSGVAVVVGQAGGEGLGALVEEKKPRVLVLDMAIARSSDFVQSLCAANPGLAVVALGVEDQEDEVILCARAGVVALVPRDGSIEDLCAVIQGAARGDFPCSPRMAGTLLRALTHAAPIDDPVGLTPREREVAALIDRGMSNKDIARELRIEVATVKNHVHRLLEKLGVHRRAHAAARIRRRSLARSSAS